MATPSLPDKPIRQSSNPSPDAFVAALERALEHIGDAAWLNAHSPLAAPYFIGNALKGTPETEASRGKVLQRMLRQATALLPDDQQRLLSASFFERKASANINNIATGLGWSRAAYYRHRAAAIQELARQLNQAIVPPLHPEQPQPKPMMGRAAVLAASLAGLRQRQTVAITGAGGMGKTTLGAAVAELWDAPLPPESPSHVFWFTVRPGLNDQLATWVFALGHFLRGLGAANTWRQMVADRGTVNPAYVLGLLRHDLASLTEATPLLVVDEVDTLRRELNEHAQIIHVLEELRGQAPMLLIGQRLLVEPHQHHTLTGLSASEGQTLMAHNAGAAVRDVDWARIQAATQGNPALLTLLAGQLGAGHALADVLPNLKTTPSLELLLDRIWRRLAEAERNVLMALSVFPTPAPQDAWPNDHALMANLLQRGLVQADAFGGIAPLPFVREFAYTRTPPDTRTVLHLQAAKIRELRAEFTLAAQHYAAGHQPAMAVWVWFNHREMEVQRGYAHAAKALFRNMAFGELAHDEDRRALAIALAELHKMSGEADEMLTNLGSVTWPTNHPAGTYANLLMGDALEMQGQLEQALARYRRGLEHHRDLNQREVVRLHARIGYIHSHRYHDVDMARRSAELAQLIAQTYKGNVEEEAGNYHEALSSYQTALRLSEGLTHNSEAMAQATENLGRIYWRLNETGLAIHYLKSAIDLDAKRGNIVGILYTYFNLSAAYVVAKNFEAALETCNQGIPLAESMNHAYLIAGLCSNAGEAHYYLGQPDEAEQFALRSLQQEEASWQPYALTVLGYVQHARGQWPDAARTLYSAIEAAQTIQDKFAEAPAWRALAAVLRDQHRHDDAANAFDKALTLFSELGLTHEINATELLRAKPSSLRAP